MDTLATATLHRISAFTDRVDGGNPAGVWIGDALPDADAMQAIAARVGYSETIFVSPMSGARRHVRYFSPLAEVAFCGHATIAAGVVLGGTAGDGRYALRTAVGDVELVVDSDAGAPSAALTSRVPRHEPADAGLVDAVLGLLGWQRDDLDPAIPPAKAWAGVWHLVLAAARPGRLATLAYPFDALQALMLREGLTTLQLVHREHATLFHSRNPFPVGGVVEDPATGAAAAALGGYLRDAGLLAAPAALEIRQGEAMGRPSRLHVDVPVSGGIRVRGTGVAIAPPEQGS